MTASNLREKLLTPQHQPFRFPNRGEVPLLPYVSHNAFSAYLQRRDDPKAAFFALVEESLADGAVLGTLSEADCDALARFYAGTMECEAAYDAARREQGGFDALRTAFASTSLWKSYLEDERRFSASLPWTIAPVVQDAVRQKTALDDTLRRLRHDPIPDQLLRAPALALPVRSSLLDLRSQVLLPKFDAITSLATVATRSADTWGALLREHRRAKEAVRAFAEQTRWVSRVPEQIARMQQLVAPVPDISLALHSASERLREVGLVPGRWPRPTPRSLARSTSWWERTTTSARTAPSSRRSYARRCPQRRPRRSARRSRPPRTRPPAPRCCCTTRRRGSCWWATRRPGWSPTL